MTFLEKLEVLERLDQLIQMKATGSPEELAGRLDLSRSTIYELLECLKYRGAEIEYSRSRRTFYYVDETRHSFRLSGGNLAKGGNFNIFYSSVRDFRTIPP